MLKRDGLDLLAELTGGLAAWEAASLPVSNRTVAPTLD